jgi:nucleotide-binding universal stress UspA family protein
VKLLDEKISTAVSLKNILFAPDFSDASEAALPYVAAMNLRYGGLVHLVLTVGPSVPKLTNAPKHGGGDQLAPINGKFRQILYATDFTPNSLGAASYAFSLARVFHARLILLHVIEEYEDHFHDRPGAIAAALRVLEQLQPEDAFLRYSPELVVQFGPPADHILQTAAGWHADLIVLGARPGHVDAATHLPWRTAHKVVARASCPVLTVRE